MDQSKEMAKLAYAALSEKKGGDIKIIGGPPVCPAVPMHSNKKALQPGGN